MSSVSIQKPHATREGDPHDYDDSYHLAHHFHTPQQQFDTGKLGIWVFLVTEVLFFSGLFVAYSVYRAYRPELFEYASGYLNTALGATNTVVLLFSSLTAAWAVRCAQLNQRTGLIACLAITIACACTFMVIKYFEYDHKIHNGLFPTFSEEGAEAYKPIEAPDGTPYDPAVAGTPPRSELKSFMGIYFCMTGLHGIHVLVGIGFLTWLLVRSVRGEFSEHYFGPVDFVALYWHIVDIIWIFLFPLLYLIRGVA